MDAQNSGDSNKAAVPASASRSPDGQVELNGLEARAISGSIGTGSLSHSNGADLSRSSPEKSGEEEHLHDFRDTQDADFDEQESGSPEHATSEAPDIFAATGTVGASLDEQVSSLPEQESQSGDQMAGTFEIGRDAAKAETIALKDALNRAHLAEVLAQLLATRRDKHPIALGLWGPWGAGKSSFVEFLKTSLDANSTASFKYADFNAWKNERVDNLGAALAQSVLEAMVRDLGFWQQTRLALKLAWLRNARLRRSVNKDLSCIKLRINRAIIFGSTYVAPFLGPLAIALLALGLFIANKPLWGYVSTLATAVATWVSVHAVRSKQLLNWFKGLLKDHRSSFKLPDYSDKIGSFHEMSRTLEDLCSLELSHKDSAAGDPNYLLVTVDDLDRCSPASIKQVFDAVRLVANIHQVVVLVALDHRIAYIAVAKHYAEYGTTDREISQLARDYLAKVFNLSVTLAPANESSIELYIKHRLFDLPEVAPAFGRHQATDSGRNLGSSTAAEAEAFNEFALAMQFTNPRELWRLRQAWALLKGIALPTRASDSAVREWMRHMFLREAIAQGTNEQRRQAEQFLSANSDEARTGLWAGPVPSIALSVLEEFDKRDPLVRAVLLPAAPAELPRPRASVG